MQDIEQFIQNHLWLCLAFIIVLLLLIILEFIKLRRAANGVTPARATQLINHFNGVVLDIRNNEAFLTGHIVGAISLPQTELLEKPKKIERFKKQPIIITCATGNDSAKTAESLKKQGFDVYILSGGLRAWRDAEMPLVKGS